MSCEYYESVMQLSCECHMSVMWLSCDCHVVVMLQDKKGIAMKSVTRRYQGGGVSTVL